MKKLLFVFSLLTVVSLFSSAQYSTNREVAYYNVISFPRYYVPFEQRTFYVDVIMTKRLNELYSPDDIARMVSVRGWTQVDHPADATVKIAFDFDNLIIETMGAADKSVHEKAKDGSEKVKPKFQGFVDYSIPVSYSVASPAKDWVGIVHSSDPKKKEIIHYEVDKVSPKRGEVEKYMVNNRDVITEDILSYEVKRSVDIAIRDMEYSFSFTTSNARVKYYFLDSKKNPNYESQKSFSQYFNSYCNSSSPYDIADDDVDRISEMISQYVTIIDGLDDSEKKQRKAKIDLMFSVAGFYLAVDRFDESKAWATRLANEYNDGDAKDLLDDIEKIENNFKKFHVTSRHFPITAPVIAVEYETVEDEDFPVKIQRSAQQQ